MLVGKAVPSTFLYTVTYFIYIAHIATPRIARGIEVCSQFTIEQTLGFAVPIHCSVRNEEPQQGFNIHTAVATILASTKEELFCGPAPLFIFSHFQKISVSKRTETNNTCYSIVDLICMQLGYHAGTHGSVNMKRPVILRFIVTRNNIGSNGLQ